MAIIAFDPNSLLNYYSARIASSVVANVNANTASSSQISAQTQMQTPPWALAPPAQEIQDASALGSDPYFSTTDSNLKSASSSSTTANSNSLLEALVSSSLAKSSSGTGNTSLSQDNDKLFAIYSALNRLDDLTQIAGRTGTVSGQLPGLDARFQNGLSQILSFVQNTNLANLSLLGGAKTSTVTGTAIVPTAPFTYQGGTVVNDSAVFNAVPGVSTSDSFTISVKSGGVTTDVPIDLSQVQGTLTLDNIASYANQQLSADGFTARLQRVQTGGSLTDGSATWGFSLVNMGGETVTLSSSDATPALYVAGSAGNVTNSAGKLIKLVNLDSDPASVFSRSITPNENAVSGNGSSTGNTTASVGNTTSSTTAATASAKNTVVDANGNVYVVGNTNGSFGGELNQGSQDVYLTKYDSAGNQQWTKLLGSASSASAYGLALAPDGGVVVAGSTSSMLTTSAIGGGSDSFVAKFNAQGDQSWVHQIAPVGDDSALAVTVAGDGSIYVGGQTTGTIASGQTSTGGTDAYVTKLDSNGNAVYSRQFGTTGSDTTTSTAIASDGNLLVASQQNGHAILTKYDSSSNTGAALWQVDLGDLQGGTLGQIAVNGNQIYLSGTTANTSLNAGGAATIANAASGGTDAFVFNATDNGASATANYVSYVGTASGDQGAGLTVSGDKVYLTGTTSGTFPGGNPIAANTANMFVAQLSADGTVDWTRQYGGIGGQSRGAAVAVDAQGASVLDALGLPRGTVNITQSPNVVSQTTARAGDYFTMQITDTNGTRSAKVTVESDDTMRSLALKVSNALLFDGKATSSYASGGHALQISVNPGVQVTLQAGSQDFDALAGLGIKPGLLINDTSKNGNTTSSGNTTAAGTTSSSSATPTVGLGLEGTFSLLTSSDALHAHNAVQGAMSLLTHAYQTLNNPGSTAASTTPTGTVPNYLQAQLAGYQTALSLFGSSSGSSASPLASLIAPISA